LFDNLTACFLISRISGGAFGFDFDFISASVRVAEAGSSSMLPHRRILTAPVTRLSDCWIVSLSDVKDRRAAALEN